jgi:hypothetical protein
MDSPILPILIGGGVLAAVVLGSRSASAQDDDYGDGYGAGPYLNVPRIPTLPDIGGNEGGAGGYGDDPVSGGEDRDYSNIPGGVTPPGPTPEPGQGLLTITVDPRVEPGTLYVVDHDGWGGRYGDRTVRSWSYREGKGMTLQIAGDPGRYSAFVRSATQRTSAGQPAKVTETVYAQVPANGRVAIYLRPNERNRAGEPPLELSGGGSAPTSPDSRFTLNMPTVPTLPRI